MSAGVFILDDTFKSDFQIRYVGRSDTNVNNQLHVYVGAYCRFKYEYYSSSKAAFEEQCNLYHDFEPANNITHPACSTGSEWKCPRCALSR
jgi:hypothetical protein